MNEEKIPERLEKIKYVMNSIEGRYNTVVDEYNSPETCLERKSELLEDVRKLDVENLFD